MNYNGNLLLSWQLVTNEIFYQKIEGKTGQNLFCFSKAKKKMLAIFFLFFLLHYCKFFCGDMINYRKLFQLGLSSLEAVLKSRVTDFKFFRKAIYDSF